MPHGGIFYIDQLPVVAIDGEGVGVVIGSGEYVRRERWSRSLWRKHLECELRRLNEWEVAERAERGRVIPMQKRG